MKTNTTSSASLITVPSGDFPEARLPGCASKVDSEAAKKLAAKVIDVFQLAKSNRENNGWDNQWLDALYQVRSQYKPDQLSKILAANQPNVFVAITATKCRAAISMLLEVVFGTDTFEMRASPVPEPPQEVIDSIAARAMQVVELFGLQLLAQSGGLEQARGQIAQVLVEKGLPQDAAVAAADALLQAKLPEMAQEAGVSAVPTEHIGILSSVLRQEYDRRAVADADEKARKMTAAIRDQFLLAGWNEALVGAIESKVVYGTGIIRGPHTSSEYRMGWKKKKGKYEPDMQERETWTFETVQPWDVYPEAGVTDIQKGDLCVKIGFFPESLRKRIGEPGWLEEGINKVLQPGEEEKDEKNGAQDSMLESQVEQARKTLAQNRNFYPQSGGKVEGIEYYGNLPGHQLIELGIDEKPGGGAIEKNEWVQVNAVVLNGQLCYLRIFDIGEKRPFSKSVCYPVQDAFWGNGLPYMMKDTQSMLNYNMRSMLVNMYYASMPQVIMNDLNRKDPRTTLVMEPGKLWMFSNRGNTSERPMYFFQPDNNIPQMMAFNDRFQRQADDDTGFPAIVQGNSFLTGAAARTAFGLSVANDAVMRMVREVTRRIDGGLIRPSVERMYTWNMLYNPDDGIKCDASADVRGVLAIALGQQKAGRYTDLLGLVKSDPLFAASLGAKGIFELFRRVLQAMDINPDDIMDTPSEEEFKAMQERIMGLLMATKAERDGASAQQGITTGQAANAGAQMLPEGGMGGRGIPPGVPPSGPSPRRQLRQPFDEGGMVSRLPQQGGGDYYAA